MDGRLSTVHHQCDHQSMGRGKGMTRQLIALRTRGLDRGATAVEYSLMVALIASVIFVAVKALGIGLGTIFNNATGMF